MFSGGTWASSRRSAHRCSCPVPTAETSACFSAMKASCDGIGPIRGWSLRVTFAYDSTYIGKRRMPADSAGNDPFFQFSTTVPPCPEPLGPLPTDKEWLAEAHHRIEDGNSCWVEGRCRLSNSYLYDVEIVDAVQRRLSDISLATHWREKSSLWLLVQHRFIYAQGCVSADFDKAEFLLELGKTADVDKVIGNMTTHPATDALPYRTLANPLGTPRPRD